MGRPSGPGSAGRWGDASGPRAASYAPALPPPDALGPDEELIAGRRPVEEAFVARRPALRLLVVPQRRQALEKLVLHATSLRIPIVEVEGGSLTSLAGFDGHQGIALVVEPRVFATLDDILARAAERNEPPFVLALDSLEDPQNVGTLLRSAEAAGVHGVLFPTRRQAPLSPSAVKASAGAVEHLLLAPVDDLAGALADLRAHGLRVAGAEADAPLTARQSDLRGPLTIVVGSEGQGLGPTIRRRCDLFMRIPMRGAIGSLNAAVAGSILLFEALAQRDPDGRSVSSRPSADDVIDASATTDSATDDVPVADAMPSSALAVEVVVPAVRPKRTRKVAVSPTAEPAPKPSPETAAKTTRKTVAKRTVAPKAAPKRVRTAAKPATTTPAGVTATASDADDDALLPGAPSGLEAPPSNGAAGDAATSIKPKRTRTPKGRA
jgi:23S rRNA (guanosine2251-2'-O)-methyltransferase